MRRVYEDYIKLIEDLDLGIPESYKKHWTPSENETFYFVTQYSSVNMSFDDEELHKKAMLIKNYNIFPNKELAEKAVNLSKLGRLILLWQYANDCILTPDWKNHNQRKYFIKHDHINNTISYCFGITAQLDTVHFKTKEQVEAFIEMYSEEIKKIMGVI